LPVLVPEFAKLLSLFGVQTLANAMFRIGNYGDIGGQEIGPQGSKLELSLFEYGSDLLPLVRWHVEAGEQASRYRFPNPVGI
jgi:hypothetical protein